MRIAELSQRSGVPTPTIKYYLREGLLPPGERTGPNQAQYDERHLRRMRLIKAMLDIGGLSIAATRDLLAAIDASGDDTHRVLGAGQYGLAARRQQPHDSGRQCTEAIATRLVTGRGWAVKPNAPAMATLTDMIAALERLGQEDFLARLDAYAAAAEAIARIDLEVVSARANVDTMVEAVILGNVLGDCLLAALRRLAQEDISARMFRVDGAAPGDPGGNANFGTAADTAGEKAKRHRVSST